MVAQTRKRHAVLAAYATSPVDVHGASEARPLIAHLPSNAPCRPSNPSSYAGPPSGNLPSVPRPPIPRPSAMPSAAMGRPRASLAIDEVALTSEPAMKPKATSGSTRGALRLTAHLSISVKMDS